jgi:DNA repair protein RecO (recombination protein O)
MFLKDRGCILRQTALPGRGKIIQLWLEREGPVSAVVFPGKKAAVHPALLQPLQMFDFELKAPGRGSHYTIREIKPLREIQDIKFINESHLMIFHLMQELIWRILKDTPADGALFELLDSHIQCLYEGNDFSLQVHISFLSCCIVHSGIQPFKNASEKPLFLNVQQGCFQDSASGTPFVSEEDTYWFERALHEDLLKFLLPSERRKALFNQLHDYYAWHIPAFGSLHSVELLRSMF